ncbi:MAG: hypothetical protein QG652_847 [Pseudomonadota bacterium]|nr:hypothetical protein [Pseudomonadota bacterium]
MKDKAYEILGKTIVGVYIKYSEDPHNTPRSQLMLVFSDYSCYEFYCTCDDIRPTNGIWPLAGFDHVFRYMNEGYFMAYQALIDPDTGNIAYESHDR